MPQQTAASMEANFSKGLLTEYTPITFPENAATDTNNCIFKRIGNVTRRPGIDYEVNSVKTITMNTNAAITTFKWNNAGGDGNTQVVVVQIGNVLNFYNSSVATITGPLSASLITSVDISSHRAFGSTAITENYECQFAEGNGYLFVFHPWLEPIYFTYTAGVITGTSIIIKVRDFTGVPEVAPTGDVRQLTTTQEHLYNLQNQGWSNGINWIASSSTSNTVTTGPKTFTVASGLAVIVGQPANINIFARGLNKTVMSGLVTAYSTTNLTINVNTIDTSEETQNYNTWQVSSIDIGLIDNFSSASGFFPSNSDVWWSFKDSTGAFDPATTLNNVSANSGPAPKGFFILDAFSQQRGVAAAVSGIASKDTSARPKTGTWFQGRVWYSGVDEASPTWTETIYFSQTVLATDQFGKCHQLNDPTSESLFDLLPTDGGTIFIPGAGVIYKLFPVQNGLVVFAANGVWYITGSQGIGFAANDYTVTKLSSVQSISGSSYIDVQGYPMWWNAEGIYTLIGDSNGTAYGPTRGAVGSGGMTVQPVTYTTIQTFYDAIPLDSKKAARGVFDPVSWEVRWIYRTTQDGGLGDRYFYDGMLTLNTVTQALYPWTIDKDTAAIRGIVYVQSPGGSTGPAPAIKYLVSESDIYFTFADERDDAYVDWASASTRVGRGGVNYESYFVSGFKLFGQGLHKFQPNYVNVFVNNKVNCTYAIQGIWDFAINRSSGKYTAQQQVTVQDTTAYFSALWRRYKIRGRGMVLQFKITSVDGAPFDILGWSVEEKVNANT